MWVVDTNVLVYAANRGADEHVACRRVVDALRASPRAFYLSWGICFEFLRVVTHPRVFQMPWSARDAWTFLELILDAPGCRLLTPEPAHANLVRALAIEEHDIRGNLWHDAETVALMRASGIQRIITRDTDFHRFRGVEVYDPLRMALP